MKLYPFLLGLGLVATVSINANAGKKTLKLDRYADDPNQAGSEIESSKIACLAGFVKGEAYGVLLTPDPADYPFDILSIDFVQGDVGSPDTENDVMIQIYNEEGTASAPTKSPIYELDSGSVLLPPDTFGMPVQEGAFMRYEFDPGGDDADHPPTIYSGNLRIMVRFENPAADLSEWAPACKAGCQDPCALADDDGGTDGRNVIQATGDNWGYNEDFGVKGDWVLRAVIDSAAASSSSGGTSSSSSGGSSSGGTGGNSGGECDSDADCPNIDQVCRAHKCQSTGAGTDTSSSCSVVSFGSERSSAPLWMLALGLYVGVRRRRG